MILNPVVYGNKSDLTIVQTGSFIDQMSGGTTTETLSEPADYVAVILCNSTDRAGEIISDERTSFGVLKPGESVENTYLSGTVFFSENKTQIEIQNPTAAVELACIYIAFKF